MHCFLYKVKIRVFQVLPEEIGGNLKGQMGILECNGAQRLEPHIKFLGLNDLLNDPQTIVPNCYVFCLLHFTLWG